MRVERVVLDTNVLISAALSPSGSPRAVVEATRAANGILVFSQETFDELRTRILGPKFDGYISREGRALYVAQLEAVSSTPPGSSPELAVDGDLSVLRGAREGR